MARHGQIRSISWILFGVFFATILMAVSPQMAKAENQVSESVLGSKPSPGFTPFKTQLEELLSESASSPDLAASSSSPASASRSKAARRCAHKRGRLAKRRCIRNLRWFFHMSKPRAKGVVQRSANHMRDTTAPDEFDHTIDPPSHWNRAFAGSCKRKSYSRVQCLGVVAADFDIIDDYGYVIDEDTFLCGWYQEVWYPYAKRPKLKSRITQATCFWASEG